MAMNVGVIFLENETRIIWLPGSRFMFIIYNQITCSIPFAGNGQIFDFMGVDTCLKHESSTSIRSPDGGCLSSVAYGNRVRGRQDRPS